MGGRPPDARNHNHSGLAGAPSGHFIETAEGSSGRARRVLALKDRRGADGGRRRTRPSGRRRYERFVTSSYYPPRPSLLAFNEKLPAFFAAHGRWDLSGRIPEKDLARVTFDPPALARFKGSLAGTGDAFPRALADVRSIVESPFGDELVLALARHAVADFRLGRNPAKAPDLLFLGLSSLDYYGHRNGPDSREVADGLVRLDGELEAFHSGSTGSRPDGRSSS